MATNNGITTVAEVIYHSSASRELFLLTAFLQILPDKRLVTKGSLINCLHWTYVRRAFGSPCYKV